MANESGGPFDGSLNEEESTLGSGQPFAALGVNDFYVDKAVSGRRCRFRISTDNPQAQHRKQNLYRKCGKNAFGWPAIEDETDCPADGESRK